MCSSVNHTDDPLCNHDAGQSFILQTPAFLCSAHGGQLPAPKRQPLFIWSFVGFFSVFSIFELYVNRIPLCASVPYHSTLRSCTWILFTFSKIITVISWIYCCLFILQLMDICTVFPVWVCHKDCFWEYSYSSVLCTCAQISTPPRNGISNCFPELLYNSYWPSIF